MVKVKMGFGSMGAEYYVHTGPGEPTLVATGKMLMGCMTFHFLVYDISGRCIAKVEQTKAMGQELKATITSGVDQWAVLTLLSALGGGGGGAAGAGGLAGAGVTG